MKNFHRKALFAAVMVVGSFFAASVRAGDLDVASTLGMQKPAHALGDTEDRARLGSDPIVSHPAPRSTVITRRIDDRGLNERNARKLNEHSENIHSSNTVSTDGEHALFAPFALPHVNVDLSGADSSEAAPNMALGPQYTLNGKVTLGGTWEGHDTIAFGAPSENEPYTFGLRVAF